MRFTREHDVEQFMVVVCLLLAILLAFPAASLAAFGLATTTDSAG